MEKDVTTEEVKLFRKVITGENGVKFPTYYGYMGTYNPSTKEFTDRLSKDGKAHSVKIHLDDSVKNELEKDNNFPYIITLTFDPKAEETYFATIDKDKEGKPRLDKEGKKHYIVFIKSIASYVHAVQKPRKLSDVDFDEI